jgi:hypothetical protein
MHVEVMHIEVIPVRVLGVGLGAVDVCPYLGINKAGSIGAVDFN